MDERHKNYLHDLGCEIVELAKSAKPKTANADPFESGRLFGYYEILDLMRQQAASFEIPLADLGLEGVDLGNFLGSQK